MRYFTLKLCYNKSFVCRSLVKWRLHRRVDRLWLPSRCDCSSLIDVSESSPRPCSLSTLSSFFLPFFHTSFLFFLNTISFFPMDFPSFCQSFLRPFLHFLHCFFAHFFTPRTTCSSLKRRLAVNGGGHKSIGKTRSIGGFVTFFKVKHFLTF